MYVGLLCHVVRVRLLFFFSSRRRHTRLQGDWSSDVCSSDLLLDEEIGGGEERRSAARLEHGAVVADTGQEAGGAPADERADQPDEVVLTRSVAAHGATAVLPRKLPSSRFPSTVRMDSGWNCTPSTGQRR